MKADMWTEEALQVINTLVSIMPTFQESVKEEEQSHQEPDVYIGHLEKLNSHATLRLFAEYYGQNHEVLSERQMSKLREWLKASVAAGGNLENAIDTCFLEGSGSKLRRSLYRTKANKA